MLETFWSEFLNDRAYALALVATVASYQLATLWAEVFMQTCCGRCEQC